MPTLRTNKSKKGENSTQSEPKIINLAIHLEKLTAQLSDGRELSIPIDWFAKWGIKGVSEEKLKRHEIWEEDEIYFPEIDDILPVRIISDGLFKSCWESREIK